MMANLDPNVRRLYPRRIPKIKKVLRRELVEEYQRIEKQLRLIQMDFDAVREEILLLVIHGYLPRIGEPEVWIDAKGSIRIEDPPSPGKD